MSKFVNGRTRTKNAREAYVQQFSYGRGLTTSANRKREAFSSLNPSADTDFAYRSTPNYLRQIAEQTSLSPTEMMAAQHIPRTASASELITRNNLTRSVNGNPKYKAQEDYYDEIQSIKRDMKTVKEENSTLRAKIRRLEEDNVRKRKEIDTLYDPNKDGDLRRALSGSLTDRTNNNTSAATNVIMSLKQRVYKLQSQLKDKEAALDEIKSDPKWTKSTELEIQNRALFGELERQKVERLNYIQQNDYVASIDEEKKNAVRKLNQEKDDFKKENESLKKKVQELEQLTHAGYSSARLPDENNDEELRRKTEDLKRMKHELEQVQNKLDKANENLKHDRSKLEQPGEDLEEIKRQRDEFHEKFQKVNKDLEKIKHDQKQSEENNENLEEIKREHNEFRDKLDKANKDLKKIERERDEYRKTLEENNEKLEEIKRERDEYRKTSEENNEKLEEIKRERDQLKKNLDLERNKQTKSNRPDGSSLALKRMEKPHEDPIKRPQSPMLEKRTPQSPLTAVHRDSNSFDEPEKPDLKQTSSPPLNTKSENPGNSASKIRPSSANTSNEPALKTAQASLRGHLTRSEDNQPSSRARMTAITEKSEPPGSDNEDIITPSKPHSSQSLIGKKQGSVLDQSKSNSNVDIGSNSRLPNNNGNLSSKPQQSASSPPVDQSTHIDGGSGSKKNPRNDQSKPGSSNQSQTQDKDSSSEPQPSSSPSKARLSTSRQISPEDPPPSSAKNPTNSKQSDQQIPKVDDDDDDVIIGY